MVPVFWEWGGLYRCRMYLFLFFSLVKATKNATVYFLHADAFFFLKKCSFLCIFFYFNVSHAIRDCITLYSGSLAPGALVRSCLELCCVCFYHVFKCCSEPIAPSGINKVVRRIYLIEMSLCFLCGSSRWTTQPFGGVSISSGEPRIKKE